MEYDMFFDSVTAQKSDPTRGDPFSTNNAHYYVLVSVLQSADLGSWLWVAGCVGAGRAVGLAV